MPVPFRVVTICYNDSIFGLAGHGVQFIRYWDNGWKNDRYHLDEWDDKMMARDLLLTGVKRGQTSEAVAPESFKTAEKIEQRYWTHTETNISH